MPCKFGVMINLQWHLHAMYVTHVLSILVLHPENVQSNWNHPGSRRKLQHCKRHTLCKAVFSQQRNDSSALLQLSQNDYSLRLQMLPTNTQLPPDYSTTALWWCVFPTGTIHFLNYNNNHSIFMYLSCLYRQSQLRRQTPWSVCSRALDNPAQRLPVGSS